MNIFVKIFRYVTGYLMIGVIILMLGLGVAQSIKFLSNVINDNNSTKGWDFIDADNQLLLKTHVLSNKNNEYVFGLLCEKEKNEEMTDEVYLTIASFEHNIFTYNEENPESTVKMKVNVKDNGKIEIGFVPLPFSSKYEETMQVLTAIDKRFTKLIINQELAVFVIFHEKVLDFPIDHPASEAIVVKLDRRFINAVNKYFKPRGCFIPYLKSRSE